MPSPPHGGFDGFLRMASLYRRAASYNAVVSCIWTIILSLPMEPFNTLPRIMVGGGPGIWLVMAYVLMIAVGVCGFIGLSYIFSSCQPMTVKAAPIRTHLAIAGFFLTYFGMIGALAILAYAGAVGGYADTILSLPAEQVRPLLQPLLMPARILSSTAAIGVLLTIAASFPTSWRLMKPDSTLRAT